MIIVIAIGILAGIAVVLALLMLGIYALYSPGKFIQRRNDYP